MDFKPGYKQTEVGVIPNEWDVVTIGSLISDYRGGASLRPSDFTSTGVKVLPKGGVGRTGWLKVEESEQKYCSPEYAAANHRNQVDETYTIVVLRDLVPSGPSIGLIVRIRDKETYVLAQGVYGFKINEKTVPGYFVHLSNTRWYRKLANSIMVGSTQVHITNTAFKRALIPFPPLSEQEAIAEALSDADAFIEALEQLLAKKRQVKQGAMQELLTGKRRLPGFSDEWKTKRLGEITEIVSGGTPSTRIDEYWNGNINWCIPTDITGTPGKYLSATEKRITELGLKNSSATLLPKGTLLLCSRATIGDVKIATDVICTNQGFKSLICSNQVHNEFLYYVLLTMKSKLIEKAIGSTFLEITKKEISLIEIKIPSVSEQTAIAEILSDMDAEVAVLEAKLSKARQVKQGMMSVLLTGRVRLM